MLSTFNMWRQGKVFELRRKEVKGRPEWWKGRGEWCGRSEKCHMCASPSATTSIFSLASQDWLLAWSESCWLADSTPGLSQSLPAATPMSSSVVAGGEQAAGRRGWVGHHFCKKLTSSKPYLSIFFNTECCVNFQPTDPLIMTNCLMFTHTYIHGCVAHLHTMDRWTYCSDMRVSADKSCITAFTPQNHHLAASQQ